VLLEFSSCFFLIVCFTGSILFLDCDSYATIKLIYSEILILTTGVIGGAGNAYPSRTLEFTSGFYWVHVTQSLIIYVVFCRSLFYFPPFFMSCPSFDFRFLVTPFPVFSGVRVICIVFC
jgi:hypothetical protein